MFHLFEKIYYFCIVLTGVLCYNDTPEVIEPFPAAAGVSLFYIILAP